ncbi:hypothetical protein ACIHEJ_13395 [Streptomyces sp. NPDC052301]
MPHGGLDLVRHPYGEIGVRQPRLAGAATTGIVTTGQPLPADPA